MSFEHGVAFYCCEQCARKPFNFRLCSPSFILRNKSKFKVQFRVTDDCLNVSQIKYKIHRKSVHFAREQLLLSEWHRKRRAEVSIEKPIKFQMYFEHIELASREQVYLCIHAAHFNMNEKKMSKVISFCPSSACASFIIHNK